MPTYTYRCSCKESFDRMKRIADRHSATCPKCGKEAKQITTAPRAINGGYYDTGLR
ncbi:zinc ribbon domain-containing protein [Serratia sp. JSRIV001]|uniref:FmdB family zinc ribbon protein n=1 Tax=Serratia sp. JSRIV001 TaxID=2831893 RepID=UPI001CBB2940|nr:zinc ribbon domain-containing protein [Serratia sp. JSRIV001]